MTEKFSVEGAAVYGMVVGLIGMYTSSAKLWAPVLKRCAASLNKKQKDASSVAMQSSMGDLFHNSPGRQQEQDPDLEHVAK
jgi:hypothetical protein